MFDMALGIVFLVVAFAVKPDFKEDSYILLIARTLVVILESLVSAFFFNNYIQGLIQ